MKRLLVFVFTVALLGGCDSNSKNGEFIDERDGKKYKTIKIGEQVWMAENLAYKPISGNYWVYDNDDSYLDKYGYLYDWETAKNICPKGWHLPSKEEIEKLYKYLGGDEGGIKMKSPYGWNNNLNGTNESGFNGLPAGRFQAPGLFLDEGTESYWHSSSKITDGGGAGASIIFWIGHFSVFNIGVASYLDGHSVRCIKDI